jgi:hypothetical protein
MTVSEAFLIFVDDILPLSARADFLLWWFVWGDTYPYEIYNTTLVTCDRFSTSSAAPLKLRIQRSGVFEALFLGCHA